MTVVLVAGMCWIEVFMIPRIVDSRDSTHDNDLKWGAEAMVCGSSIFSIYKRCLRVFGIYSQSLRHGKRKIAEKNTRLIVVIVSLKLVKW